MARFSSEVIKLAQETQTKYGVPASVTLAQYAVESGYGKSGLATKANNYFGITGKNHSTGKYVVMNGREWASYGSMAESFDDHGRLLSTPLYANAHKNTTNVNAYVDAIAEIYAPSSDGNNGYAALVKQVIAENNLTQYDGNTLPDWLYNERDMSNPRHNAALEAATTGEIPASVFSSDYWLEILGKIVKFLALVAVGVMAAIFFFNAFNFDPKNIAKKAIAKAAGMEGGADGE